MLWILRRHIPVWWVIIAPRNIIPIGNESVPIQLAQCWFPGLAIFNAKTEHIFWNKVCKSNFIKKQSETVMVWNQQNADNSLKNKSIALFVIIFGIPSFPVPRSNQRLQLLFPRVESRRWFIYIFKHQRQRAEATYMPVKSVQWTFTHGKQ